MENKIKSCLLLLITGWAVYYFLRHGSEFLQLLDLSLGNAIALGSVIFIFFIFNGLRFKELFFPFDVSLERKEWFGLALILQLGNFIFFKAGTVTFAVYLKKRHELTYTKYIAAMAADKAFLLFAITGLGLFLAVGLDLEKNLRVYTITILSSLISILIWVLFRITIKKPEWDNYLGRLIDKFFEAWIIMKNNRMIIVKLILIHTSILLVWGVRFFVAFNILNIPIGYQEALALAVTTFFTSLVNLVPGALGIREITAGVSLAFLGQSFDHGVFAVTLDRLLSTLMFGVLGIFYLNHLQVYSFEKDTSQLSKS